MKLVITEKPSVARDIARVMGASEKGDGFISGNGLTLTWCFGHLLELQEPAHYDDAWRRWTLKTLPMVPESFALKVRKGAKEQWGVVRRCGRDSSGLQLTRLHL